MSNHIIALLISRFAMGFFMVKLIGEDKSWGEAGEAKNFTLGHFIAGSLVLSAFYQKNYVYIDFGEGVCHDPSFAPMELIGGILFLFIKQQNSGKICFRQYEKKIHLRILNSTS